MKKLKAAMAVAEAVSKQSPDIERQVGCVLVHIESNSMMATGYNGFVRGAWDEKLPNTGEEKHEFIVHAEANMIYNCARHGISMADCKVVCTLSPCKECVRSMYQCGITRVIFKDKHGSFKDVLKMKDLHVHTTKTYEYYQMTIGIKGN